MSSRPLRIARLTALLLAGLGVAASNWRLPTSYVGHDYSFRPYFSEARGCWCTSP